MEMSAKYIIRFDSAILLSEEQTCMCWASARFVLYIFGSAQRTARPCRGSGVSGEWRAVAFSNKANSSANISISGCISGNWRMEIEKRELK